MRGEGSAPVVVAGVDGSEASKHALRWAAHQAELTGAELRVLCVWHVPVGYGSRYGVPAEYGSADFEGAARRDIQAAVEEVLGEDRPIPVTQRLVEGHPAPTLIEASQDADLLVVGSRGRGAFAGMLLGSVSAHCVHHAGCPVVVVRHPTD